MEQNSSCGATQPTEKGWKQLVSSAGNLQYKDKAYRPVAFSVHQIL
jgi:hypothetical protein